MYRKRDIRAKKHKLKKSKQFLTNFSIFEWITVSMHAFPHILLYINLSFQLKTEREVAQKIWTLSFYILGKYIFIS